MTTRNTRLCRLDEVLDRRGSSRSGHYRDVARGLWTRPVRIGERAVAWPEHEIDALVNATIAGENQADRKALVDRLHREREQLRLEGD